jgi:hypothetical protein
LAFQIFQIFRVFTPFPEKVPKKSQNNFWAESLVKRWPSAIQNYIWDFFGTFSFNSGVEPKKINI